MKYIYLTLVMLMVTKVSATEDFKLGGFTETVFIVSDIKKSTKFYQQFAGWEVRTSETPNEKLKQLWKIPSQVEVQQVLLANKGENKGFVRLVQVNGLEKHGIKQQQIRSNTQSWDTGGVFDVNARVADMDVKFQQLQQQGWLSATDPIQFTFGPFVVKEWIVKGDDGIAFALIERIKPTLKGWPNLKEFSRVFNSTQVVKNIDQSRKFYEKVLGFKPYLEHKGASKKQGPNVLGLPHNLTTEIERSVIILHPDGINEGSVELLQFHGATGRDVSELAAPPNIGIAALRFPVDNLKALKLKLIANEITIESQQQMSLYPYGNVEVLAIRTPDNTWLEFYQKLN